MPELDETSHDIGELRGKVDMLIALHTQSSSRHQDMHNSTHEKLDRLFESLDGRMKGHDSRLSTVEHKITYQRGVIATLSTLAGVFGAWIMKALQSLLP